MIWRNEQISEKETEKVLEIAQECLVLDGDFVEMGCYRGDTSLLLAEILRENERSMKNGERRDKNPQGAEVQGGVEKCGRKKLWLYDSFEGLPEKSEEDLSVLGAEFEKGVLSISKREVKARFLRAELPVPKIIKGWFSDLEPDDLPERIAFSFLDGDLYKSIKDCLKLVKPKMVDGGVILVHDYNNPALPGVAKAVEEAWNREEITVYESLAILKIKNRL